jgi:hypothetical protein
MLELMLFDMLTFRGDDESLQLLDESADVPKEYLAAMFHQGSLTQELYAVCAERLTRIYDACQNEIDNHIHSGNSVAFVTIPGQQSNFSGLPLNNKFYKTLEPMSKHATHDWTRLESLRLGAHHVSYSPLFTVEKTRKLNQLNLHRYSEFFSHDSEMKARMLGMLNHMYRMITLSPVLNRNKPQLSEEAQRVYPGWEVVWRIYMKLSALEASVRKP